MTDPNEKIRFSRRKVLGSVATIGAAGALGGAATSALLWDEEKFGMANNPNILQAGKLDLKVDWEAQYYNWIDDDGDGEIDEFGDNVDDGEYVGPGVELLDHTSDSDDDGNEPDLVDQPGPLVKLTDIKPGDVLEVTLSAHIFGNPAFLSVHYEEHADTEGDPPNNEPEREAENDTDPELLDEDGGELDEYINCVVWHDDGDNLPGEVWDGETDLPDGHGENNHEDSPDDTFDPSTRHDYAMEVGDAQAPSDIVTDNHHLIFAGTLSDLDPMTRLTLNSQNSIAGTPAQGNFGNTEPSMCYENSDTEYIGVLCWLPSDIPGVVDNVVQGDRVEFQFGFDAVQCRHNVAEDGSPIDGNIADADAENNAKSPGS